MQKRIDHPPDHTKTEQGKPPGVGEVQFPEKIEADECHNQKEYDTAQAKSLTEKAKIIQRCRCAKCRRIGNAAVKVGVVADGNENIHSAVVIRHKGDQTFSSRSTICIRIWISHGEHQSAVDVHAIGGEHFWHVDGVALFCIRQLNPHGVGAGAVPSLFPLVADGQTVGGVDVGIDHVTIRRTHGEILRCEQDAGIIHPVVPEIAVGIFAQILLRENQKPVDCLCGALAVLVIVVVQCAEKQRGDECSEEHAEINTELEFLGTAHGRFAFFRRSTSTVRSTALPATRIMPAGMSQRSACCFSCVAASLTIWNVPRLVVRM